MVDVRITRSCSASEHIYILLTLTQEKNVKVSRFPLLLHQF